MVDSNFITDVEAKKILNQLQIQEVAAKEDEALCFMAQPLIHCTLPHSKTLGTNFVRKNGHITLELIASSKFGLPYGTIPRLLLIWMSSEATRRKCRKLELGDNLSEFLKKLDLQRTGGERGYIRAVQRQMDALFTSHVCIMVETDELRAFQNMVPVNNYVCWFHGENARQKSLFKSELELSEEFYEEIIKAAVPLDMRALKILRKSPLAMDIYQWLSLKNFTARKPIPIKWQSLQFQFGANYPNSSEGRRNFKKKFLQALAKVGTVYEEARRQRPEQDHLLFIPGRPHIKP